MIWVKCVAFCVCATNDIQGKNVKQKKLAGQIIHEHDKLGLDLEADIIEYRRAMEPDIIVRLRETADQAKDKQGYFGKDFYVVLLITINRVLRQPRIIPLAR